MSLIFFIVFYRGKKYIQISIYVSSWMLEVVYLYLYIYGMFTLVCLSLTPVVIDVFICKYVVQ